MKKSINAVVAVTAALTLLTATLFLAGCPMETPEKAGARESWLDPRLVGAWRFSFNGSYEECVIGTESRYGAAENDGNTPLRYLVFGYDGWGGEWDPNHEGGYHIFFGGDIVYAKAFRTSYEDNKSAGIIIIKCWPDYPVKWPWWSEQPPGWSAQGYRDSTKTYYGMYYINMWHDGSQVFIAQSNEQATNYGPTETATLEEAIEKFTESNINNLLNLDVGDPQQRYTGEWGFQGLETLP